MTGFIDIDPSKLARHCRIIYNQGCTWVHCEISNLSSSGAKLNINKYSVVPQKFDFEIPDCDFRHGAELVWRQLDSIGIKFIGNPAALCSSKSDIQKIIDENRRLRRNIDLLRERLLALGFDIDTILSKAA